ncbi:MAG TPA: hypothetical protein VGD71_03400, partial [Kribbella sp.]
RLDARQVIRNGQLVRSNAVATPLQSIVWAPVPLLLAQKYDAEESGELRWCSASFAMSTPTVAKQLIDTFRQAGVERI